MLEQDHFDLRIKIPVALLDCLEKTFIACLLYDDKNTGSEDPCSWPCTALLSPPCLSTRQVTTDPSTSMAAKAPSLA